MDNKPVNITFIPGLGYDYRIFENLEIPDAHTECLSWIEPQRAETLHAYAQRMYAQIKNKEEPLTLIGHSLGGMVAQEIASVRNIKQIMLISSIKSRSEMPLSFKIIRPLHLSKLFTKEISIKTVRFWGNNHGFETDTEKELFRSMVGSQTNTYLQWALRELSSWQAPEIPATTSLLHIHGTNDKTFPIHLVKKPDLVIEKGSHIAVYKQADIISEFITQHIIR